MANRVVTKNLAGIEDLLLGTGSVTQTRAGTSKSITKIDASGLIYENATTLRNKLADKVDVVNTLADLRATNPDTDAERYIFVLGNIIPGDGGAGLFYWDERNTDTDDGKIVIKAVPTTGRWLLSDKAKQMSGPGLVDTDYTIKDNDYGIILYSTSPLTAARYITLPTAFPGKTVAIFRGATGDFPLNITTDGSTPLYVLPKSGYMLLTYSDDAGWVELVNTSASTSSSAADSFNGSFELDSDSDGVPDNWTANPYSNGTVAVDSTTAAHGLQSIRFTSGGSGGGTLVSDKFDVQQGSDLSVSFTYLSSSATTLNKVNVKTYDINGTLLSTLSVYSEGTNNPTTFTEQEGVVTLDNTAVQAEIELVGIDTTGTTTSSGTYTIFDNVRYEAYQSISTMEIDASGTRNVITFNVPKWANKVIVYFIGVTLSGSSDQYIKVTDTNGNLITSGYNGYTEYFNAIDAGTEVGYVAGGTYFRLMRSGTSGIAINGKAELIITPSLVGFSSLLYGMRDLGGGTSIPTSFKGFSSVTSSGVSSITVYSGAVLFTGGTIVAKFER